jgi:hypothetical protein
MKPRVLFNRKDAMLSLPIAFSSAIGVFAPIFSRPVWQHAAISGDLLSAVVSTCYILGFRKDNPNVFNMLVQNLPHSSGK